jgi:hypothetical protein
LHDNPIVPGLKPKRLVVELSRLFQQRPNADFEFVLGDAAVLPSERLVFQR